MALTSKTYYSLIVIPLLSIVLGGAATFNGTDANNPDSIVGFWWTENQQCKVEIFEQDDYYHGKVVWMQAPNDLAGNPKLDKLNPLRNRRKKPILGLQIAFDFEYNNWDNLWEDGRLYNPETGETMKATIQQIDKNTIELTGFVGFSLSEVKITWKRADS